MGAGTALETRGIVAPLRTALASMRKARGSVGGKLMLVVLLATGSALLVAGVALLLSDLHENRAALAADLLTEARILELSTAPALAFDDRGTAQRNLAALQARGSLRVAALYGPDGRLYASYVRSGREAPPPVARFAEGSEIGGDRIEVWHAVARGGELLGTIYLRADYDWTARARAYLGILVVVLCASLGVAFVLSGWLRRVLTGPLESITRVAQAVVARRDYSLRARRTSDDEIGVVVDAFNDMLVEVQSRTRALEEANHALHEQIEVRRATERALRESERLYRAIGESIDYGVFVCDAAGRCIYASESLLRLTGRTQRQISEFGWLDSLHPDEADATLAAWQDCVARGGDWYREQRFRGSDGQWHSLLTRGVPIRDEHGAISGWAGINLDIRLLKLTEEALREADRRKDEFLATLAHELRNPLAPIRHAVRLLDAPGADESQRRWGREVIGRQVAQMALLLDDLLDVSRITRGKLELRRQRASLRQIVDVALETARPLVEAKRHRLEVSLPPDDGQVDVDPLRISQVIGNLLTNAAKYTDPGGNLRLAATTRDRDLRVSVGDDGIGLAPQAIPQLFAMFSQLDAARDRAEGGLGIGLSLVRGLVALHGGHVAAHSAGLGLGSEFVVELPGVVIATQGAAPVAATPAQPAAPCRAATASRRTVLVADDNRDAASALAMILELGGHRVLKAFSGREALELAARERPQAIMLDIGMPGLTGYEAARRIRQEPWGRGIVLVAVTGWGQEHDKRLAAEAGFDVHLTKPVDPAQIEQVLADAGVARD